MIPPERYNELAARAGVTWQEEYRFVRGHIAQVLLDNGEGFFHPCTCELGTSHQAFVPTDNPTSEQEPTYVPLPEVVVPDPTDADAGTDPVPTDPTMNTDDDPTLPHPGPNVRADDHAFDENDGNGGNGDHGPDPEPDSHSNSDPDQN